VSYTIVGWYTPDYEACADRLIASLKRHGYENYIMYPQIPVGRWGANVRYYKPRVLAQALRELDGDIVYLDADAVVHGKMTLFDEWGDEDFGAHWRAGQELLGGTLYLKPSVRLIFMLDDIASLMESANLVWQQAAQITILHHSEVRVKKLPPEYCCIFDSMRMANPGIQPIIEHMQYSRQVPH